MKGVLIGLAMSVAGLAWAIVSWRTYAAREAKRKTRQAAERAKFAGGTRGANADPTPELTPRRSRIEFGRR